MMGNQFKHGAHDCWFSRDVIKFLNTNLLGLLNFYGHYVFSQVFSNMIFFSFEIWHAEFLRFPPCVTSRWRRDKAVVLEKKDLLLIVLQFKQLKYWERYALMYYLARKEQSPL